MVALSLLQFLHALAQPHIVEIHYFKLRDQIDPSFGDSSKYFPAVLNFLREVSDQWNGEKIFAALLFLLAVAWRVLETRSPKQPRISN
jgi:hypothetical protein